MNFQVNRSYPIGFGLQRFFVKSIDVDNAMVKGYRVPFDESLARGSSTTIGMKYLEDQVNNAYRSLSIMCEQSGSKNGVDFIGLELENLKSGVDKPEESIFDFIGVRMILEPRDPMQITPDEIERNVGETCKEVTIEGQRTGYMTPSMTGDDVEAHLEDDLFKIGFMNFYAPLSVLDDIESMSHALRHAYLDTQPLPFEFAKEVDALLPHMISEDWDGVAKIHFNTLSDADKHPFSIDVDGFDIYIESLEHARKKAAAIMLYCDNMPLGSGMRNTITVKTEDSVDFSLAWIEIQSIKSVLHSTRSDICGLEKHVHDVVIIGEENTIEGLSISDIDQVYGILFGHDAKDRLTLAKQTMKDIENGDVIAPSAWDALCQCVIEQVRAAHIAQSCGMLESNLPKHRMAKLAYNVALENENLIPRLGESLSMG